MGELGEIIINEEEIRDKIREIGSQISKDYAGKDLVLVCVLKGGCVFPFDHLRGVPIRTSC